MYSETITALTRKRKPHTVTYSHVMKAFSTHLASTESREQYKTSPHSVLLSTVRKIRLMHPRIIVMFGRQKLKLLPEYHRRRRIPPRGEKSTTSILLNKTIVHRTRMPQRDSELLSTHLPRFVMISGHMLVVDTTKTDRQLWNKLTLLLDLLH